MRETPVTAADVGAKAEWEGGIIEVFEHGAFRNATFADPEFGKRFRAVEAAWYAIQGQVEALGEECEEAMNAEIEAERKEMGWA